MRQHRHQLGLALLTALLLGTGISQAAERNYTFSGLLDSGAYSGEAFSGSFSFDDAALTGLNDEYLNLSSLNFSFLGHGYTQADADLAPEAAFLDGTFLGLNVTVSATDPQFSLIAGFFDPTEAYFAYQPSLGSAGYGSVSYVAAVPEAESYALMLAGLGLVGITLRRRSVR